MACYAATCSLRAKSCFVCAVAMFARMARADCSSPMSGKHWRGLTRSLTMLEDAERIARRVLGGAHPFTVGVEKSLRNARTVLAARDGDDVRAVREALRKAKV